MAFRSRGRGMVPALFLFVLLSLPARGGEGPDRASTVTLPSIRNDVLRIHNLIGSLEAIYLQTTDTTSSSSPERYRRVRFLAKNGLRLRETWHSTTRFPESVDLNHITQFLTHDSFDYFIHKSRYYEKSRRGFISPTTWKLKDDDYLRMCGWWPNDDEPSTEADSDFAIHLRFVVENPHYALLADAESVDGHSCCVVENSGVDRLWLDPALGYAIRKREIYDERGRVRHRSCVKSFQRCDLTGKTNEQASVWMPTRIFNEFKTDDANVRSDSRTGLAKAEIVVQWVSVNSVDDQSFRFIPPPGTLVYDRDVNSWRQIPGGRDLLDENIAIEQERRRIERPTSAPPGFETYLLMVCVAALVVSNVYSFLSFRST